MKIKVFIISFLGALPVWLGLNFLAADVSDFMGFAARPNISSNNFLAQAGLGISKPEPFEKENILAKGDLEISATAAISLLVDKNGKENILFGKNISEPLPIASISKLMSAEIIFEFFDLQEIIKISKTAASQPEDFGQLKEGDLFSVNDLLFLMLIESSNDALYAAAEKIGQKAFVDLMNLQAKTIGLESTYFSNSMGIDPGSPDEKINQSSAKDLAKLAKYLFEQRPEIWEITSAKEMAFYSLDGEYHHQLLNTNKLLGEMSGIIGGKTGETPQSSGNLILLVKGNNPGEYLINVILGSNDRFSEMKKLVEGVLSFSK